MAKRIALVAWWLGALFAALMAVLVAINLATPTKDMVETLVLIGVTLAVVTGPLWMAAFVLGGSFWKPPQP